MIKAGVLGLMLALTACSSTQPRCDSRLQPINVEPTSAMGAPAAVPKDVP